MTEINPYDYLNKSNEELEAYLNKLKDAYYNTQALVSDEVFDDLRDELYKRAPHSEFFSEIGYKSNNDVKLPYAMYSLDKITPSKNNFDNWISKYSGPYVISDKMDGISCLAVKRKDITKLYLRSTADLGSDISYVLPYININVKPLPNNWAIRGELIISRSNFQKLSGLYKSPRMGVNGIIKRKIIDKKLLSYVDFISYSIVHPRFKQNEQYAILNHLGFKTTPNKIFNRISLEMMVDYFKKRRELSEYDIDGIVICDITKTYDYPTKRNPEYQIAFKSLYDEQAQITRIKSIEWNLSKYGVYCPVVHVEPVHILDAEVSKVTGHNAKFVVDNGLGPGAIIKLIKSGDIIPHILEVLKPVEPQMPKEKYVWNDSKVDIIVPKVHGQAQARQITIKQLISSMKILDVPGFGEKRVALIVEGCNCNSIYDIINVPIKKMQEFLGPKNGIQLHNALIEKLKKATLDKIMIASNCFDSGLIGIKRIKTILKEIPDILTTKKNIRNIIMEIPSFNEKTTDAVIDGLECFKIFLVDFNANQNEIKLEFTTEDIIKLTQSHNFNINFEYNKVAITGSRDTKILNFIETAGANIMSSVNGNTDLLIYADTDKAKNSVKYKNAIKLGIKMMSTNEFIEKYLQ